MTVSFRPPKPQALLWVDFEGTGVTDTNDFSGIHILEACVILTDFDLVPFGGYTAVITPTAEAIAALKENPGALDMHRTSGLLAALKGETETLAELEQGVIKMIKRQSTFGEGEFMIAGSGVAMYDFPLIKQWMPALNKYLAYFPFDIGVERRVSTILNGGRSVVPPNTASYGDKKLHRSEADVRAHLKEAEQYKDFFRSLKS